MVLYSVSMKHSEIHISRCAALLMWLLPLVLAVPNVALSLMGEMAFWSSLANVALPVGIYLLLLSAWKLPGRTVILMLPLMLLAAFQIVLLFIYGDGSIIGVDMFLNVVTTNSSEAMELLDKLLPAIVIVFVLYLPWIVVASITWIRCQTPGKRSRRMARICGVSVSVIGAVGLLMSCLRVDYYRVDEDLYPVNVLCNLGAAIKRSTASANYHETSADFRFFAVSERPDSLRELYIAVIGETSRADNWQLHGYGRFTTPKLCAMPDSVLAACDMAFSESNVTHKSVPLLLSTLDSSDFSDSINVTKSVISAFNEAGFRTAFISLQARNNSYIDFFGLEADTTVFLRETEPGRFVRNLYDMDVLPLLDSVLAECAQKQLVVLHLYGSHFNYSDRYSRSEAFFLPDLADGAKRSNCRQLINAYDNSIRETDRLLTEVIARLDSINCLGGMIFTSDHGEDIYDDERDRFLHASPKPTYMQLHVPFLLYFTPSLRHFDKGKWHAAQVNTDLRVSSSASFAPTLLDMAALHTPRLDPRNSLTSHYFHPNSEPLFLNDRNRAETLREAGFHDLDFIRLHSLISARRYHSQR